MPGVPDDCLAERLAGKLAAYNYKLDVAQRTLSQLVIYDCAFSVGANYSEKGQENLVSNILVGKGESSV